MERESIPVKPGWEYDYYFPKAKVGTITVKKGATVTDTLELIPKIVRISMPQTKRFAEEVIKGRTIEETCRNLWEFTYGHIAYKKDADRKEQVRDAARIWNDRHNVDPKNPSIKMGVDCDCMSVWCASILCNLGLGKYLYFRITKYPDPNNRWKKAEDISFSHIYPILILPNGRQITIDCVVHQFNYEEPYLQNQDTPMDLEYLNGVPDSNRSANIDTTDLMGLMDEQQALAELGKIFKKKANANKSAGNNAAGHQKKKGAFLKKVGKVMGKGLHVANRINPATALLRGGVLAAMKLNFMKIAGNLRWTYLSEEAAKAKDVIMDKFRKLVKVREKLEKIFYGAGGKPENLRKAMLKGHGNKDKAVPLAGLNYSSENIDGLHEDMSLSQLLGSELYHSEYVDGMEELSGFGELGEPATAASIAAATTVLTTIAALIKSVGSIFPNKGKAKKGGQSDAGDDNTQPDNSSAGSDTSDSSGSGDASSSTSPASDDNGSDNNASSNNSAPDSNDNSGGDDNASSGDDAGSGNREDSTTNGSNTKSKAPAKGGDDDDDDDNAGAKTPAARTAAKTTPPAKTTSANKTTPADTKKPSFWDSNKKWIKPVGITVGSLGLIALMYQLLKPKPKAQHAVNGLTRKRKPKPKGNLLQGIKSKKKKGGHAPAKRKTKKKKQVITLL